MDWLNGNLYWTESTHRQVWVARIDGSFQKILVKTWSRPLGIVVDPIRRSVRHPAVIVEEF